MHAKNKSMPDSLLLNASIGASTSGSLGGSSHTFADGQSEATKVALNGLFPVEFPNNNANGSQKVVISKGSINGPLEGDSCPVVDIHNARQLHSGRVLTRDNAAQVFHNKGFCCLPQQTKVEDWNEDYFKGTCCFGAVNCMGSDISNVYALEVEEIIRNLLLPNYDVVEVVCHNAVLKRGPGSKNNFYGSGVHQDYGLTMPDFLNSLASFDKSGYMAGMTSNKYARPEVQGFMVINFWRPIGQYTRENPLLSSPLAVCDPSTVKNEHTVHTGLDAGAIGGVPGAITDQMGLRHNHGHSWWYYPRMTNDEVLVFKQFECWKTDSDDRTCVPVRGCFHTAFDDPGAPEEAPPRTSSEYRVYVYVGGRKEAPTAAGAEPWQPPAPL